MICTARLIVVAAACFVLATSGAKAEEVRLGDDVLDTVTAGLQTLPPVFTTELSSQFNTAVGLPSGPITGPAPIVLPDPDPTPDLPGNAAGLLAAIFAAIGITF